MKAFCQPMAWVAGNRAAISKVCTALPAAYWQDAVDPFAGALRGSFPSAGSSIRGDWSVQSQSSSSFVARRDRTVHPAMAILVKQLLREFARSLARDRKS